MEHTKLPLKYKQNISSYSVFDRFGKTVCTTKTEANAAFIVKAANNHDELLAACKVSYALLNGLLDEPSPPLKQLREIIAKVEAE